MKTVKVHIHCTVCGFSVEYDLDTNEYGFFVMPEVHYDINEIQKEI